jgi:hypothetical protein
MGRGKTIMGNDKQRTQVGVLLSARLCLDKSGSIFVLNEGI